MHLGAFQEFAARGHVEELLARNEIDSRVRRSRRAAGRAWCSDTDSSMSGSRSSSALTRLVLPAPDGAQTMKRFRVVMVAEARRDAEAPAVSSLV